MSRVENAKPTQPNLETAKKFLEWLDPGATAFTFQTFHDTKAMKSQLAEIVNAPFAGAAARLMSSSNKGAGVFITVNETDLRGRSRDNIVNVRAMFVDLDDAPVINLNKVALDSRCLVNTSKGRHQSFWLVEGVSVQEFGSLHRRLISLVGGDSNCHGAQTVMRLPGFPHQKQNPVEVTADIPNIRVVYSRDQFISALEQGEKLNGVTSPASSTAPEYLANYKGPMTNSNISTEPVNLNDVRSALAAIPNNDLEYDDYIKMGMILHSIDQQEMWLEWCAKSPKNDKRGNVYKWGSFKKSGGISISSLFHWAMQRGWRKGVGLKVVEGGTTRDSHESDATRKTTNEEIPPQTNREEPVILSYKTPNTSAQELIKRRYTRGGIRTLTFVRGTYYLWNGIQYEERDEIYIRGDVLRFLEEAFRYEKPQGVKDAEWTLAPFEPQPQHVNAVLFSLATLAQSWALKEFPYWSSKVKGPPPANEVLACANGALHLPTKQITANTPGFRNVNSLDFDYSPGAPKPAKWLEFLDEALNKEQDAIDVIQEMFGLMLTSDTSYQKGLWLIGPPGSGKGTIIRVMKRIVGESSSVSFNSLKALSNDHSTAALVNKKLLTFPDLKAVDGTDIEAARGVLLAVIGEDDVLVNVKGGKISSQKLSARVVVGSNDPPKTSDASNALTMRFIVVQTHGEHRKSGDANERLYAELTAPEELPGLLNWAIDGLDRLTERRRFIQPKSSMSRVDEMEAASNPLKSFVEEYCVVGKKASVRCNVLYEAYEEWAHDEGIKYALSSQELGRRIRSAVPSVTTVRAMRDGVRKKDYEGITINDAGEQLREDRRKRMRGGGLEY